MYLMILKEVLKFEGGYVNDPADRGGATNKGVTQKTYDTFRQKAGFAQQNVKLISDNEVSQIYYSYWKGAHCDKIVPTHPLTAAVLFDMAINSGPKNGIRILQKSIGAKPVDGIFGNGSLISLLASNDLQAANKFIDERTSFYFNIVDKDATQYKFLKGWIKRLTHLRKLIYEWSGNSKQSNPGPSTS